MINENQSSLIYLIGFIVFGGILGFFLGKSKTPEVITETEIQFILQKCEPNRLEYAKFELERKKYFDKKCPNGGQESDNIFSSEIRCFEE